ncbi:hypothetical protein C1645_835211 [Glomus cerebriforme]|uniref:Uncharacterized protein n=1 Tax=Glomus cerebriforme TaxID=658196 RepID=A0A397SEY8_9GLOM|nr:hypothetical protein C1645_835211 [Glomus cerebriforme]
MTSHEGHTEPENISKQVQQDDTNKEQVKLTQLNSTISLYIGHTFRSWEDVDTFR